MKKVDPQQNVFICKLLCFFNAISVAIHCIFSEIYPFTNKAQKCKRIRHGVLHSSVCIELMRIKPCLMLQQGSSVPDCGSAPLHCHQKVKLSGFSRSYIYLQEFCAGVGRCILISCTFDYLKNSVSVSPSYTPDVYMVSKTESPRPPERF